MDRMRKRWTLRVALVIVAAGGMLVWALQHQADSVLKIANQSGQVITQLEITSGDQSATFSNVGPGREVPVPFITHGDVPFTLRGKYADNSILHISGRVPSDLKIAVPPSRGLQLPADKG